MPKRTTRTCSLCGYEFDATGLACHTSCPLNHKCHIVCCPNCGYQTYDETEMKFTGAIKRIWEAYRAAGHSEVKL